MRTVFMGSAPLACRCLEALLSSGEDSVSAVVTQPDRPRGRRLKVAPCAVKVLAAEAGLPILTPARVNTEESLAAIAGFAPEVIVVVAYGQILKPALLGLPPAGCVNLHASLLPRLRGAAPVQWALARGEEVTGMTSMYMNEGMDEGDIIFQESLRIGPDETADSLHDRLAALAGEVLLTTLAALREDRAPRRAQNDDEATYAPKLTRQDGRIDWTMSARAIYNRVRAFTPWPGSYCKCPGDPTAVLKVKRVRVEPAPAAGAAPGEVIGVDAEGPLVGAGVEAVRLLEVQPAGRKTMTGAAYLCGHRLQGGERFG